MTEAEEQGSNPSDATTASDVPSQEDEGPGTAQTAPTAVVFNASSIIGEPSSSQSRVEIKPKKPKFGGFSLNDLDTSLEARLQQALTWQEPMVDVVRDHDSACHVGHSFLY